MIHVWIVIVVKIFIKLQSNFERSLIIDKLIDVSILPYGSFFWCLGVWGQTIPRCLTFFEFQVSNRFWKVFDGLKLFICRLNFDHFSYIREDLIDIVFWVDQIIPIAINIWHILSLKDGDNKILDLSFTFFLFFIENFIVMFQELLVYWILSLEVLDLLGFWLIVFQHEIIWHWLNNGLVFSEKFNTPIRCIVSEYVFSCLNTSERCS